ncbi:MAG: hypothetical protein OEY93_12565, partial [Anaerolineae bacterium]|nr:hypothetical protein [Anaerolineae bacterium]
MKINRIIVLFGLLSLLFSACQSSRAIKGAKPSQEWSRSQELGRQAIGAPALAPIDSNSFAVLYPARAGGEDILKMFTLSTSGEVIAESEIMLAGSLRFPQMFYNPAGYFDLFVGNRLPQEETWQIKHIKLSLQGEQISPPERINPKDSGTGVFDAAADGKGGYALVWDEDSFGETYYQQLDPQG